jgi:hypothetical protein
MPQAAGASIAAGAGTARWQIAICHQLDCLLVELELPCLPSSALHHAGQQIVF